MSELPVCNDTLKVETENGLHLIPCSQIAILAAEFDGSIILRKGDATADATSPIHIAALGASKGTVLDVEARGEGCVQIVQALKDLFASGFPTEEPGEVGG